MRFTLAELMVCAASHIFDDEGEVLVTGIGLLPRLAASLAMRSSNPDLLMTDSQSYVLSQPNAVSGLDSHKGQANENWMGFARIFDNVWSGRRHALVGPSQIDRFGQSNISALGGTHQAPKVQLLGVRGFPGNSISHANSFFVPSHSRRVFVEGECDVVCSVGYNNDRLPRGYSFSDIDIRTVVTNLCVLDFNGPNKQMRVATLHPGVGLDEVQDNTGFDLAVADDMGETTMPSDEQLDLLSQLDPLNVRARQLKNNPAGIRQTVETQS
jgi:glutaconate CoA-transferase subunit B